MIEKETVKKLVDAKLKGSEDYPVDITVRPDNFITVEIDNDHGVSIDSCVALSRFIESSLDRETEDFELEVGSPGITSPFKTFRQYLKNTGNEVEMLLNNGIKLTGILKAADDTAATLTVKKTVRPEGSKRKITVTEDRTYSYDEIKQTKYLLRF